MFKPNLEGALNKIINLLIKKLKSLVKDFSLLLTNNH